MPKVMLKFEKSQNFVFPQQLRHMHKLTQFYIERYQVEPLIDIIYEIVIIIVVWVDIAVSYI